MQMRASFLLIALLVLGQPQVVDANGGGAACLGDCDGCRSVGISELVRGVQILLGRRPLSFCPAFDDGSGAVTVAVLIRAVRNSLDGCPPDASPTPSVATAIPTATATPNAQVPPAGGQPLLEWLRAGNYRDWQAEPAQHQSAGPHFGDVRTFVNDALSSSLMRIPPTDQHPRGSAAVKELFGRNGGAVNGWSVSIKLEADSDGGNGWYWYERFGTSVFADGQGVGGCTGCHGTSTMNNVSRDYFLSSSSFPTAACAPENDPLDVCGNLATPDLACAYDGMVTRADGAEQPTSLYLWRGEVWFESWIYRPRSNPGSVAYEGEFSKRFCAGDFPKPVPGALTLTKDLSQVEFSTDAEGGGIAFRFVGQRRD